MPDSSASRATDAGSSSSSKRDSGSDAQPHDAGTSCSIDGGTYTIGEEDPGNACQICDPSATTSGWSDVTDGTSCGSGMICYTGACVSGCEIGTIYYQADAPNPDDPCQSCEPSATTSGWTDVADGDGCGSGTVCHTGACVSGCGIGGVYYAPSAANPNNACQSCQPGASTSAWTSASNGTSCGNGQVCAAGACGTQCDIGDAGIVATGTLNPSNPCQSCQPGTSTTAWSDLAQGTSCATGEICDTGSCVADCYIGTTLFTESTANPSNACQSCQPATSTSAWTNLADGTSCGTDMVCSGGTCVAECDINGTEYASGTVNPANSCQSCQPSTSSTAWSNVADGTSCRTGHVCSAGSCVSDCYINGTIYTSGTANPSNPCQTCQPHDSTTAWTNADGTACGGTYEVCSGGSCLPGCVINGRDFAQGAADPGDACHVCTPAQSQTAWTLLPDGTSCGTNKVCNAGACCNSTGICGTACCNGGQTCSDPATGTCCWGWQTDCGSACCNPGQTCTDATTGTCS